MAAGGPPRLWWRDTEIQCSGARHDAKMMEIRVVTLWSRGMRWQHYGVDAEPVGDSKDF
jgi:hypothetical protein